MNPIGPAISAVALAWEVINNYLELREVAADARKTFIEPLQELLNKPSIANACKTNPSDAVQGALVNINKAAEGITERAKQIRGKARWKQIMFAKTYSAKLLRHIAGLHMRVSELQVVLAANADGMLYDIREQNKRIQEQNNAIQQQHRETLARLDRWEAGTSISKASVRAQLCDALVNAVDRGDTAEALSIERVMAFLDGTPSNMGPREVQQMLLELQGQISDAQVDKSHAEAELLEQFAQYLRVQDGRPAGEPSAGASSATGDIGMKQHVTCIICQDVYTDPVRDAHTCMHAHTRSMREHANKYTHTHTYMRVT